MKKIYLFFAFVAFLISTSVNAMTLSVTGDSTAKVGKEITVYITLSKDSLEDDVSAVDGTIHFNKENFEIIKITNLMENWTELSKISNEKKFSYANLKFDNLITSNSQNIVEIKMKVKEDASYGDSFIMVSNPSATNELGDGIKITGGRHLVRILSEENTLSSLNVKDIEINFDEKITTYNLTTTNKSTVIEAVAKDNKATVTGDIGLKELNYGLNVFKITVTSESGLEKDYIVKITRNKIEEPENNEKPGDDENIDNQEQPGENDKPNEEENKPTTNPENNENVVEKPDVTDKPNDNNEQVKSNNNYLSELSLSEGNLVFDKNKKNYIVTVLYEISQINIYANPEDKKASYEIIGDTNLTVGENNFVINVKAEDGSIRKYTITVIRAEENIKLSSNSKLKNLAIDNHSLDFDNNKFEYLIEIENEDKLNIIYETEDEKSTVTIKGNEDLKNGSKIEIIVVAEDGSTTTYSINIQKNNSINISLFILIILFIIMIFLVIKQKYLKKKETV